MCVSDTSGRSGKSVFARAHGKTPTNRPDATSAPASCKSLGARFLTGLVRGYQLVISPWIGPRCRFLPTCSDYALDALTQHGAIRGGWLTVRRLARCHPLGGSGFDPVPATSAIPKAYSEAAVHRSASAGAKVPQARA